MEKKVKIISAYLIFVFNIFYSSNYAQLNLPTFISDNMVLQQNFSAPIWGWAEPKSKITIAVSWNNHLYETESDDKGKWIKIINTPSAGGPYSITINDSIINNVLIGEVWICSGQSNMQWALSQTENAESEIETASNSDIRLFYAARDNSDTPNNNVYGKWTICSPENASSFSAVAYYFGKEIYNELKVPIGLIHVSWGGSTAEAWINKDVLKSNEIGRYYIKKFNEKIESTDPGINPRNHQSPSSLYNGMLRPFIPYGIKGAIWYQGESNTNEHYLYRDLMEILISSWRSEWAQGDFPFYFVQLAPYNYNKEIIGAALRDAQRNSLDIPNTGMAVTMDIGNPDDIHPVNKKDVGKRLSLWALAKTYGKNDLIYSGPLYKHMKIENDRIRIYFDHTGGGLICKGDELSHFTIAGKDQIFVPASAVIENNTIVVSSPKVGDPKAVRFAFKNGDEPNLFNKEGLPASTFRTDNWDIITETAEIIAEFDTISKDIIIKMESNPQHEIRYTLNGDDPDTNSSLYSKPVKISEDALIKARIYSNSRPSLLISEAVIERHSALGKKVTYIDKYDSKYPGSGEYGLVNSITGDKDFADGRWQGFLGKDFNIIIDLEEETDISKIQINFLQNVGSWILLPAYVQILSSGDGNSFNEIANEKHDIPASEMADIIKKFDFKFQNIRTRYIKIFAKNSGQLPDWHPGAGNDSWLFTDEVIVN